MNIPNNENTDNSINVIDTRLGNFKLQLPEKPIWFGDHHGGKLAIFLADIVGTTSIPCFGLIWVISESLEPEMDQIGYAMYSFLQTYEIAVTHVLAQLETQYIQRAQVLKDNEEPTLH